MAAKAAGVVPRCFLCGGESELEIHHAFNRKWIASQSSRWQRQIVYEREFEDSQVVLACGTCNKRLGPPTNPNDEVPF